MNNSNDELCPLRYMTKILGGKWKMSIICILSNLDAIRYSAIKRKLKDITDIMLAQSLRELSNEGLVNRIQYNEIPPRVEYSLTESGRSVLPVLASAYDWAAKKNAC